MTYTYKFRQGNRSAVEWQTNYTNIYIYRSPPLHIRPGQTQLRKSKSWISLIIINC